MRKSVGSMYSGWSVYYFDQEYPTSWNRFFCDPEDQHGAPDLGVRLCVTT